MQGKNRWKALIYAGSFLFIYTEMLRYMLKIANFCLFCVILQ